MVRYNINPNQTSTHYLTDENGINIVNGSDIQKKNISLTENDKIREIE